ncbi:hypothetical protein MUK42_32535 [Musa troglodytarum]|uniref:Uncharacterized protein n=1 Tax=Musa troglodytarum TaxID=320322 RepID=A0A9E7HYN4_9LILI|nr:hypothetical protein MUK42_32535 [Musa troglodytarum]
MTVPPPSPSCKLLSVEAICKSSITTATSLIDTIGTICKINGKTSKQNESNATSIRAGTIRFDYYTGPISSRLLYGGGAKLMM